MPPVSRRESGRWAGDVIQEHMGQLGRIPEARGYLMSRRGLLEYLVKSGRHAEAIAECEQLARLDAFDHVVARFVHLDLLITNGRLEEARRLCDSRREETYSGWAYYRLLIEFAASGDAPETRRLLAEAVAANPHVPRLMLSGEQVEPEDLLVTVGEEDEAALYVRDARATWLDVPGAVAWLRSATDGGHVKPDRRRRPPRARDLDQLAELPQEADEEWQIDLRRNEDGSWTSHVFSGVDGRILAIDVQPKRPRGESLWGLLADVMRRPREGDPRPPGPD